MQPKSGRSDRIDVTDFHGPRYRRGTEPGIDARAFALEELIESAVMHCRFR